MHAGICCGGAPRRGWAAHLVSQSFLVPNWVARLSDTVHLGAAPASGFVGEVRGTQQPQHKQRGGVRPAVRRGQWCGVERHAARHAAQRDAAVLAGRGRCAWTPRRAHRPQSVSAPTKMAQALSTR
jgi:hypothetical protein